jgi:hypothetical protein
VALAATLTAVAHCAILHKGRRDKLFFIGPNKTGTTSIAALFARLGYESCHWSCRRPHGYENWAEASVAKDARYFKGSDAFSDVGHLANFVWLSQQYPSARFVYNTRPIGLQLMSRIDMHRRSREALACAPYGGHEPGGRCGTAHGWNDGDAVRFFTIQIAAQQAAVRTYFDSSPSLRNRFATHDFTGGATAAQTQALISWITRNNLGANTTDVLLLAPGQLPAARGAGVPPQWAQQRSAMPLVPHANAAPTGRHSAETVRLVTDALERSGCVARMHADLWIASCAEAIMANHPELRRTYDRLYRLRLEGSGLEPPPPAAAAPAVGAGVGG